MQVGSRQQRTAEVFAAGKKAGRLAGLALIRCVGPRIALAGRGWRVCSAVKRGQKLTHSPGFGWEDQTRRNRAACFSNESLVRGRGWAALVANVIKLM